MALFKRKPKSIIIEFVELHELDNNGYKKYYFSNVNKHFVTNSMSYQRNVAYKFYNELIELRGVTKKEVILDRTKLD